IQIVGPGLHHPSPLRQEFCRVVALTNFIPLHVCELELDRVLVPLLLVQQSARGTAEPMRAMLLPRESHRPQRDVQRVLRERSRGVAQPGETYPFPSLPVSGWISRNTATA